MTPIWGEDGRVALIETVIRDVSERHVQTEQLRESEARFRRLTEEVADVLWRVRSRPSVEMEYMSPAVTRLLGYTPEEFYKDPGLMYRVAVEEQRGALRAVTAGDYDYSRPLEVCFRHREGGRVWLEMSMTAEYDELGRFVAVQGVSRDVTGKHQEAARPRGRGVRARLLEHARDVIWQLQLWPERRFEYVSPSVERLLGHACDEFLADATLFSRLLAPECVALVERFNAGDFDPEELQLLRWIRRDGAEVWTEGRVTPVRDAGGRLVAVRGVARDVTDRILVERDGQSRGWRGLRRRPVRQK
jgi:PAS domain S-box-containing protein